MDIDLYATREILEEEKIDYFPTLSVTEIQRQLRSRVLSCTVVG